MIPRVFISYSHKDADTVSWLEPALQAHGIHVWVDQNSNIGSSISKSVRDEIARADRVLVCLSRNSIRSDWVSQEIVIALERERAERSTILLPLKLDDFPVNSWKSELRHYLSDRLSVNLSSTVPVTQSRDTVLQAVLKAISQDEPPRLLLQGTWSYRVKNLTDRRILVGAFRIEAERHGLVVSEGLSCNVTSCEPKDQPSWEKWYASLVAYDGKEVGIYFDCEFVGDGVHRPYGIRTEGGWRLSHDGLTSMSGRAYHVIDELKAAEIHVRMDRLDAPAERPPPLRKALEQAYRSRYRKEVAAFRREFLSAAGQSSSSAAHR